MNERFKRYYFTVAIWKQIVCCGEWGMPYELIWHKQAWADLGMDLLWKVPYIDVHLPTVSSSISECHMALWINSPLCRINSTWRTQKSDTNVLNSPEFKWDKKSSIQPAGVGNRKKWNVTKPFVLQWTKTTQPDSLSSDPPVQKAQFLLSCSADLIPLQSRSNHLNAGRMEHRNM